LRRYLSRLFERWEMQWAIKQVCPLADLDGSPALWRARAKAGKSSALLNRAEISRRCFQRT